MRKFIILGCFALVACSGGAANEGLKIATVGGSVSGVLLPKAQVDTMVAQCQANAPLLAPVVAAPGVPAKVSQTAAYPVAYCNQLLAAVAAGQPLPAATTPSTPAWLPGALQLAGTVAQIALPILIGAL